MIYDDIKSAQIAARKEKDKVKALCLTTLMGELQNKSTSTGDKSVSDDLVISTLKKFIKDINFTLSNQINDNPSLVREHLILSTILDENTPDQMSDIDIKTAMESLIGDGATNIGLIMKGMKEKYSGLYDGKSASLIAKSILK